MFKKGNDARTRLKIEFENALKLCFFKITSSSSPCREGESENPSNICLSSPIHIHTNVHTTIPPNKIILCSTNFIYFETCFTHNSPTPRTPGFQPLSVLWAYARYRDSISQHESIIRLVTWRCCCKRLAIQNFFSQ